MNKPYPTNEWQRIDSNEFWGEIAPGDHVVQIYEKDDDLLDLLENFVTGGIKSNDSVIVIATAAHLQLLEDRLQIYGLDTEALISDDQYILLNADRALARFMVNDWPDEILFMDFVSEITKKARKNNRNLRAFGEMVAILLAKGYKEATIRLEYLWNKFFEKETLCLFCAYPKSDLTQSPTSSVMNICCSHTKMVTGKNKSKTEMFYKSTGSYQAV